MSMGGLTDSPMEAVAIMNYLRVQHGAWAWLAAFLTTTAAAIISIGRLSSRLSPIVNIISISSSRSLSQMPQQTTEVAEADAKKNETPCSSNTINTLSSSIFATTLSCTLEKTASGKFTLYYARDDTIDSNDLSHEFMDLDDDDDDDDDDDKLPAAAARSAINRCSSWSACSNQVQHQWDLATLKMKKMDLGLYNHQDLARLDGNVVRLWN